MASYLDKVGQEGTDFTSLVEDDEFKADLVKFFSGGRYKYTKEQMREKGFDGLAKDFVEHMRFQDWNEVTAVKDLNYVKNKDMGEGGKQAFGRLMQAWDGSESAGTGFFDTTGDIGEAILKAPSTYVGLSSFGLGKVASKAGAKATQLFVRKEVGNLLKKNVFGNSIMKEAAIGAASGAAMGGGQAIAQGETREEVIEDYDYTAMDALGDAAVNGAIGAGLGAISGALGRGRAKKVDDFLTERKTVLAADAEKASAEAEKTLKTYENRGEYKAAAGIVNDLNDILSARAGNRSATIRDPLDPERVAAGRRILGAMSDPKGKPTFESGLSVDTMRGIAAASIDIMDQFKVKGDERITETVARALRDGDADAVLGNLDNIRKKYGLSKDEFSMIYLAEVSKAGQILGFQSAIKRGAKVKTKDVSAADYLFSKGASTVSDEDMKNIAAQAVRNSKPGVVVPFLQDLDAMRIAFMTSQPATTMRNFRNAAIMIGTDMVDQTNKALYKGLTGDTKAVKDFIPNMTAIVKGYTFKKSEAEMVRAMLLDEMPEAMRRLYANAARVEVGLESGSVMAKAGRFVNTFNTASDSILKEGIFYGNLDRQMREQGTSLTEWLKTNKTFDKLPEGVSIDSAVDEANRLTMQRDFRGDDSALAKATKGLSNLNRKAPFLVSTALGIPFPRYLGNHLNTIAEYTPVIGEVLYRTGVTSGAEDAATRVARQMTGFQALIAGYVAADMRQGEVDYGSIKKEMGSVEDMKPYIGSYLAHMWVGDRLWRKENGMPLSEGDALGKELKDVFGGIPDFSFDLTMPIEGFKSVADLDTTEKFEKEVGNFLSTFTMPAALARDVVGQFSYEQAGSPYVRDLALDKDVSTKGAGGGKGILAGQATRMLPDFDFVQYTQSFDGKNDLPYYKITNPVAIGKVNPLLKQISGSTDEPPLTELEKEMSKANIKDYVIYKSYNVNPNVDFVVRQRLAKSLYKDFEDWRKQPIYTAGYKSYDELEDPKFKAMYLEKFISQRIKDEKELVEGKFDLLMARDEVKARGYIRNNYVYKEKELGRDRFDEAARIVGFDTAREYIASSDNVTEEVQRRMRIVSIAESIVEPKPY